MLSINTNLPSIIAQNSLKQSTLKLNTAIERMTTGYKINGVKDNAANYSIATNMTTKIGAYQIAEDNCAMGLDLITTADESLSLISGHVSRIRDLAMQAANGTYGNQSLNAINAEVNARVDEMLRLFNTTEYNRMKLFGEVSEYGFMEEVVKRDTTNMTALADVAESTAITSGTYSISTPEELAKLASMTNNGKVNGGEFVLANDIDLSKYSTGEGWIPIGDNNRFIGKFDGNGYIIDNLYINKEYIDMGLFGFVEDAEINNLGVENVNIKSGDCVGTLVGFLRAGSVTNCYSTGTIKAINTIGGLVGAAVDATISNSYSAVNVFSTAGRVGGLIGEVGSSTITNCFSIGNVEGDGLVGGLMGAAGEATISNCYATGNVAGSESVGGFIAVTARSNITNCYSTGNVTANQDYDSFIYNRSGGTIVSSGAIANGDEVPYFYTVDNFKPASALAFQVGINGNDSSQIHADTSFLLNNIMALRTGNLNHIDNLLNVISAKQTEYGAIQNRLESALDEISTQYDNLVSSRSTLRDADIAKVSSEYIRQQILQQASATLLSTANQTPALALQLL